MFFTVEPMINLGRPHVKVLSDGWTAVTRDRSLSAQFEHTIGVTDKGVEIFTPSPEGPRQAALFGTERAFPRLHDRAFAASMGLRLRRARMPNDRTATSEAALPRPSRAAAQALSGRPARQALADYEMLELVLFRAIPRRDVKPLAKELIEEFGSFAEVISAPVARLSKVKGLGDAAITELKIVQAAASRIGTRRGAEARQCCRRGRRCSIIAAPPWPSTTRKRSASCFSTSATN